MGRDSHRMPSLRDQRGFNPRARMGRDDLADRCEAAIMRFNPRARMGRDTNNYAPSGRDSGFNPRARMGRDVLTSSYPMRLAVSIHAPVWGATPYAWAHQGGSEVSIHAPVWGATSCPPAPRVTTWCFNPRARMGRDVTISLPPWANRCFNPRARMGRDILSAIHTHQFEVSIHAPVWGAT